MPGLVLEETEHVLWNGMRHDYVGACRDDSSSWFNLHCHDTLLPRALSEPLMLQIEIEGLQHNMIWP